MTTAPQPEPGTAELAGIIINVQRFSTHDGPGIRTTVFLKGCTNSCAWCHNPESMQLQPELQVYPEHCLACGRCVAVCETGAHSLVDGVKTFDRARCTGCGRCVEECFAGALSMAGERYTVGRVMEQILQDAPYYRHSGGGVTFSGGEPVLQRAFLAGLLRACGEAGVHRAIETALNYPWEWLAPMLPDIELVMCDLKTLDPRLHAQYVGNDGARIRGNILRLGAAGVPLIVRTPVVGGVNDSPDQIADIARFVGGFADLQYYELLPYHPLGESKRVSLGLAPEDRFYTPDAAAMAALADAARPHVPEVRP